MYMDWSSSETFVGVKAMHIEYSATAAVGHIDLVALEGSYCDTTEGCPLEEPP